MFKFKRKTSRRKQVMQVKILFASHVFIYTSRDGMVISNILNVAPQKLHDWSKTDDWDTALKFWRYEGSAEIQGDLYRQEVGISLMQRSFNFAEKLWLELFGQTEKRKLLNRFIRREVK